MKPKFSLKDWQKLLVPEFTISAISIEERMVRVFCFDKTINKITKVGKYALPPGIIEEGILKKPQELQSFFLSLKQKIWPKTKEIWLVLSLPSANFYTNLLSLPDLEEERFKDAVIFNTQMVAPLPLEEVYFDWEDWGQSVKDNEREVFIALANKKQVNPYLEVLEKAGFKIVAVESWAIGLVRFLNYFGEKNQSVLSVSLRTEGIEFVLSEGNKLIFFDFDSWSEIFGPKIPKQITIDMIKKHLDNEIPMLLNFYSLKRKKPVQKFIFLSSDNKFNQILSQFIFETYKLQPFGIALPGYMRWVALDWFSAIGSALRGLIPRYQDTIVSLSPVGTEESYSQNHLYRVASLWAKIGLTVILLLTGVFGLLDNVLFRNIANRYAQSLTMPLDRATLEKENILVQQANEFNALVNILNQIKNYQESDYQILSKIFNSARQNNIIIKRILMSNQPANNVTILGSATNKINVSTWKQSLETAAILKDINLPLQSLVETPEGVTFILNAKL
ncbi:MAG: pilus assembly protein PilM [Parcubacteria group bacterium]|nr:pilus assembly protein PilM [Parcubacteria group bacterium]